MTRFTVDWDPEVEENLTRLWLRAPDKAFRDAITTASDRLEKILERNPLGTAHHLSEGLYQLIEPPLAICFSVDTVERRVEVSSVRLIS